MLLRLHTEDKNRKGLLTLCNQYFTGYTITQGLGAWKGVEEHSLTIEVSTKVKVDIEKAKLLAEAIKVQNKQEAVLLEILESNNVLI